jgi:hypothetical protein
MSTPLINVQKEILKQLKDQFPTKFVAMYQTDKLASAKRACLLELVQMNFDRPDQEGRMKAQCGFHLYCMSAKTSMHDPFALTDFATRAGLYVQEHGRWGESDSVSMPRDIDVQPYDLPLYSDSFWTFKVAWTQDVYLSESYWNQAASAPKEFCLKEDRHVSFHTN